MVKEKGEHENGPENQEIPSHLTRWPGLYIRKGSTIVEALPEDISVAQSYPTAKDKGEVTRGKRLTILTKKNCYTVNEEVRVIHVCEAVEHGHDVFIMGPKPIYGEYVDGRLVTPERAPEQIYDGHVLASPAVDYNYDITCYRFSEPGYHQIFWKIDEHRSNTLNLKVALDG